MRKTTALVATSLFVLGIVAQPIIAQLVGTELEVPEKVLVGVSVVLAVTLLTTVNALLLFHRRSEERMKAVVERFNALDARLGLRVEFIVRGEAGSHSDPYGIMRELAAEARHEILLLDHRPSDAADRFGAHTTLTDPSRARYYEILTQQATRPRADGSYLRYRRVVQLDEGPTSVWDTGINQDVTFGTHVNEIVATRERFAQCPSAVKTSRMLYPNAHLMLVDHRTILMELAVAGPGNQPQIQGDLIFHDPDGRLAGPLRQLFENIDAQATLVTSVV